MLFRCYKYVQDSSEARLSIQSPLRSWRCSRCITRAVLSCGKGKADVSKWFGSYLVLRREGLKGHSQLQIQYGAATCSEGFVNCFLTVPQAVGLYCSSHDAFRKHIKKLLEQVAAPDCTVQGYSSSRSQCFVKVFAKSCEGLLGQWVAK